MPQPSVFVLFKIFEFEIDSSLEVWENHRWLSRIYIDTPAKQKPMILRQIHTADPVGMGKKNCACTLYWNIVHWHDFLPKLAGSAVCILHNTLFFHFAGSSIHVQISHLWEKPQKMLWSFYFPVSRYACMYASQFHDYAYTGESV